MIIEEKKIKEPICRIKLAHQDKCAWAIVHLSMLLKKRKKKKRNGRLSTSSRGSVTICFFILSINNTHFKL